MAPHDTNKKSSARKSTNARKRKYEEVQVSKSPAEFFAENQAIAGFDNNGKSLFTTIRELVENSLDACESVNILPDIVVKIEELTQTQFNEIRGVTKSSQERDLDEGLFVKSGGNRQDKSKGETDKENSKEKKHTPGKKNPKSKTEEAYFRIIVRDNGCGMKHDAIPNLLGKVLSGSKYGVRQTRGKFGLGAKMALIWSKKSTGVPIRVKTAHMLDDTRPPSHISTCVLDIDIYKNAPRVLKHNKSTNQEKWKGSEFEVLVAGNWVTYKSRIVHYLHQLAIITPYAKLEMHYSNLLDNKKDMTIRYERRSEQMPPPASEVKHHPSSVNNLIIQQLLHKTKSKTFLKFLTSDLSGVSSSIAKRIIAELGEDFDELMEPSDITENYITTLVQLLRRVELFKAPDGSCLSPLGEYNLNLGIRKVIEPDVIATSRDKTCSYEGHPFIVEAAVCLGGKNAKEGINVFRFANRIPLLFEGGADVVTRVAQNKIKWSSYKIDHKRDKIGVFVSIVSTKIPFKGTGKEYIGDDIMEIQISVKRALQSCCQQLRSHLTKRNALRDLKERRSRLVKYVPDASRSIFGIIDAMKKRYEDSSESENCLKSSKNVRTGINENIKIMMQKIESNEINENKFSEHLMKAIEAQGNLEDKDNLNPFSQESRIKSGKNKFLVPLYLKPFFDISKPVSEFQHPLFHFRSFIEVKELKKV